MIGFVLKSANVHLAAVKFQAERKALSLSLFLSAAFSCLLHGLLLKVEFQTSVLKNSSQAVSER